MRASVHSVRRVRIPAVARRYADVLTIPGARAFFLSAVPARIGFAMTGLGLLWLVRWGTGSYAAAGVVTGLFAVTSALAAPMFGRLVGRFGQGRVLVPAVLLHVSAIGGVVVAVTLHCPLWIVVSFGVVAGAAQPQVSSLTATRWSVLLAGSSALPTAFALESLSNELAFLFGPALVGTVSAVVVAPAGAVLAAALMLLGCLALARQRATEPTRSAGADPVGSARVGLWGPFGALALVNLGIGFFFGALQVSVTAFATERGVPDSAGLIYSLLSVTSLVAGFGYGARKWRMPARRQLVVALAVLTAGGVPMIFAGTPTTLALSLLLAGFGLAPSMIVVTLLAERIVPKPALTRAFTMLNSAGAVGTALAAATAGRAVDAHGAGWGFAIAVGAVGAATVVGLVVARRGG